VAGAASGAAGSAAGTSGVAGAVGAGGTIVSAGGASGSAGVPGAGGAAGSAGAPATGGAAGSQAGTGGAAGTVGTGGSGSGGSSGTGPCAGLCTNPITVAAEVDSGSLGTAASCYQVLAGGIANVTCGNFVAPRTFSVNGTSIDCVTNEGGALPAERNGGYCMQVGAGQYSYAYFVTY
jgi:hypothetical protein